MVFVDNKSVRDMINATSTSCKNCMTLIRIFLMKCLVENVHVKAKYVKSSDNDLADDLSRGRISSFKKKKKNCDAAPTKIAEQIWPVKKIWLKN